MNKIKLITIIGALLTLTACSQLSTKSQVNSGSRSTDSSPTPADQATPAPDMQVESSGNVDADFEEIEKELDNLNFEQDFPSLDESDFE